MLFLIVGPISLKDQACRNRKSHVRTSVLTCKKSVLTSGSNVLTCSHIFVRTPQFCQNFSRCAHPKFSRYAQPMLQNFSHTAHDRYFSRTQYAYAKKKKNGKQRPVLIYNKNILLCFLVLFSSLKQMSFNYYCTHCNTI